MTETDQPESPIALLVPVSDVPGEGRRFRFTATTEDLVRLTRELAIPAVTAARAEVLVKPLGRSAFTVTGFVSADVIQTCVVTLENFPQSFEEPVEVKLGTAADLAAFEKRRAKLEEDEDGEGEEAPDLYDGQVIDLGLIIAEHIALGLDLYPRKPGVEFDVPEVAPPVEEQQPSPFAALSRLKKDE